LKRCLNCKRGQIRVIEAFFASILLLSTLALAPAVQKAASGSNSVLSSRARSLLSSLDSNGHLARIVDQHNWSALRQSLEVVLPTTIWFNLTILDEDMLPVNSVLICNGGVVSDHIEAADYLCVSVSGNYAVYTLRLQLAGLD
jgi:hypothetical protein